MAAYLTAMAISAGIYALLALGVNLTRGMAGMINLGLAGFFAVGGYATALLTKAGVSIPLGIAAGHWLLRSPAPASRWSPRGCVPITLPSSRSVSQNSYASRRPTRSG
jgi:ABC-type branched-subunit amino acid transport system permease subunit